MAYSDYFLESECNSSLDEKIGIIKENISRAGVLNKKTKELQISNGAINVKNDLGGGLLKITFQKKKLLKMKNLKLYTKKLVY